MFNKIQKSPVNYKRAFTVATTRSPTANLKHNGKTSYCEQDGPDAYHQAQKDLWNKTGKNMNGRSTFSSSQLPRFTTFGTTSDSGYHKGRNLGGENLREQFRFFDSGKGSPAKKCAQ
jgi:hypothetical protein